MRLVIAALATLAVCAGVAPAAQAVNRYAEPGGEASGACTDSTPGHRCEFEYAVEAAAGAHDNVILAPGSYTESGSIVVDEQGVDIIGPGAGEAKLNSSAPTALEVNSLAAGSSVSGLTILHTGSGDGLLLDASTKIERLSVTSTAGLSACHALNESTEIVDTVCQNTNGGGGAAILINPNTSGGSTHDLRNVTAYATGGTARALRVAAIGTAVVSVNAANSIFRAAGAGVDIHAFTDAISQAGVHAYYSAYVDTEEVAAGDVTIAGTEHNITALPLFENAGDGFHQAAGSPTIDKGTATPTFPWLSALDIDGEARIMGLAPDIGADEFVPPPAQQQPTTQSPTGPTGVAPGRTCPKGKKLVTKKGKRKCVPKRKRSKR